MSTILKVDFKSIPKRSKTPIFAYCRKLLTEGVGEDTILEVYRGETLSMRMPVWAGARLMIIEPDSRTGCGPMHYALWKPYPTKDAA